MSDKREKILGIISKIEYRTIGNKSFHNRLTDAILTHVDSEIESKEKELEDAEDLIKKLNGLLADQHEENSKLNNELLKREKECEELDEIIDKQNKIIALSKSLCQIKEKENTNLEKESKEKDKRIQELEKQADCYHKGHPVISKEDHNDCLCPDCGITL